MRRDAPAAIIVVMDRELERKVERRIRLWILEQERDRQREGQRRAAVQPGAPRDSHK